MIIRPLVSTFYIFQNALIPSVITFYSKNEACILKIQNWNGFLPIYASANKQYCAMINFLVSLASQVLCHKGQYWDHFYSFFSLMIYRILRLMVV